MYSQNIVCLVQNFLFSTNYTLIINIILVFLSNEDKIYILQFSKYMSSPVYHYLRNEMVPFLLFCLQLGFGFDCLIGISTFIGYLMPESSLLKTSSAHVEKVGNCGYLVPPFPPPQVEVGERFEEMLNYFSC